MSFLLFMFLGSPAALIRKSFSDRHKSHTLWPAVYTWQFFKIDHVIFGSAALPLSSLLRLLSHTKVARVDAFFFASSLNDCLWPHILCLIALAVRPM